MADDPERDDPVLVRPYITTQPADGTTGSGDRAQTWPAAADLPEDGTRELAAVEAPSTVPDPAGKSTALRRQRLLVLAGIAALALLGGAGLFFILPAQDDGAPVTALPAPVPPPVTGSPGAAPLASAGTLSASASNRAGSRPAGSSRGPAATSPVPGAAGRPATTAPASGAPGPTLSPPPDPARTGPVTAAGGRCLAIGTLLALNGSQVQTSGCSNVSYQRWTLATDGTLQVTDRCARVGDDAAVRIEACDDDAAAQWRAGPDGSLVNPDTGRCLTDPGTAVRPVTVTECTGAADQRWSLP
jgi:hypothetical protein